MSINNFVVYFFIFFLSKNAFNNNTPIADRLLGSKYIELIFKNEILLRYRYIAVLVWIPELFSRYHKYMELKSKHTNICKASQNLMIHNNNSADDIISINAYLPSFIVALFTIPLVVITGVAIKYLNKKLLLCTFETFVAKA